MRRAHVKNLLDAYYDGELEEPLRQECEVHLLLCPSCRQALAERSAISRVLRGWEQAHLAEGFAARVIAARERFLAHGAVHWRRLAGSFTTAAGAAAIAVAISFSTLQLGELITRTTPRPAVSASRDESDLQDIFLQSEPAEAAFLLPSLTRP